MARARQIGGGVEVEGLAESIRALKRLDPLYRKEAVQVMRDAATDVQKVAQGNIGAGGGRYPQRRGMIGRSSTGAGAGVKLRASRYPWALGAEFGEKVAHVYGRPRSQSGFRRRTMPPHRPATSRDLAVNRGGWMIQPAIRSRLPHWNREAARQLQELITKALRSAGVPRGR